MQDRTEGCGKPRCEEKEGEEEEKAEEEGRGGRGRAVEGAGGKWREEELQAAATPPPACPDPWSHGFGLSCGPFGPRGPEPAAVSAAGRAAQGERATAGRLGPG